MTSVPLVSVVIPVYNVEAYVRECLKSLIAQTHEYLDIVVVNDGSTDGTGLLCDELAQSDPRIRVIHQSNQGASQARNTGLDAIAGEFVCFVDGDDAVHPRYVDGLLRALTSASADIAVCGFFQSIGEDLSGPMVRVVPDRGGEIVDGREAQRYLLDEGKLVMTVLCNKIYQTHVFDDLRMAGDIYEDDDIMYLILAHAGNIAFVSDPSYYYRTRTGSTMTTEWSEKNLSILDIYRRRSTYYDARGDDELALLARAHYLATLLWVHPLVHDSKIADRTSWLGRIRAEISRLDSPEVRRGLGRYTTILLRIHLMSPTVAAHVHRVTTRARSALAAWGGRAAVRATRA